MSGIEGYIYVAIEGRGNIKVSADGPDSKVHRANMGPTWGAGGGLGWYCTVCFRSAALSSLICVAATDGWIMNLNKMLWFGQKQAHENQVELGVY